MLKRIFYLILLLVLQHNLLAQDWAELGRYRDDNARLKKSAKSENIVVFLGNSITDSWPSNMPEFFEKNNFVGRGISGQTTPQMLVRFRPDVIDLNPAAVVILAGTNDIAENTGPATIEEIFGNICSMAELAAANNIKVILCAVLPAFDYPWRSGLKPAEKIVRLNSLLKDYATKNGHAFLDYHSPMADEKNGMLEQYTYDGVHPNDAGYLLMASMVEKVLSKILKE
ncbi:MAG: SGNH/GDSL hydrolase family protein [Bacteroidales bacterium]|nr:SGNH/GDSL hydrolase family protein [Bacteroidales bacterium]